MNEAKILNKRRMKHVGVFVDLSVKSIMTQKVEDLLKNRHINPTVVANKLAETLRESLFCEKEQELHDLLDEIEQVTAEKNKYEIELKKFEKKKSIENAVLEDQNIQLRQQHQEMKQKLESYKEKLSKLPNDLETTFNQQQQTIDNFNSIFKQTKEACQLMREELNILKTQTKKNLAKQIKVIHSVVPALIQQATSSISVEKNATPSKTKTQCIELKCNTLKRENEQLKTVCSTLLQTLFEVNPTSTVFNKYTIDEIEGNSEILKELECAIREIPAVIRKDVKENIENSIFEKYPEYRNEMEQMDVNDIIKGIIEKRQMQKNREYDAQLRHLQKKEKQLRKKLQEALEVMPKEPIKTEMSTFIGMQEAEKAHFDWEKYRKSLDMKMSELDSLSSNSRKSRTLRSKSKL